MLKGLRVQAVNPGFKAMINLISLTCLCEDQYQTWQAMWRGKKSFSGTTWAVRGSHKENPAKLGIHDCLVMLLCQHRFHHHHPIIMPELLPLIHTGHVYHCRLSWTNNEDQPWRGDGFTSYPHSEGYCSYLCTSSLLFFSRYRGFFHYNPVIRIITILRCF